MPGPYFIGVDVGTGSVRAALVSQDGEIVSSATQAIKIWEPQPDFYEQSSEEIWETCCKVVQIVTQNISKDEVLGLGFDATCSLVVLDRSGGPLAVSSSGDNHWNVVMWMDHRASEQAEKINQTKHEVLKYVGGKIYLEMETPKLLWLKENLKQECWDKAGHFFDLPDFLMYKATGSLSRSLCSLVCKWTYFADQSGRREWSDTFFIQIGLGDLVNEDYSRIGQEVLTPGDRIEGGLSQEAAEQLGLNPGTAVATSLIDAHAGALGTLGCRPEGSARSEELAQTPLVNRMALICGTSTCHMTVMPEPVFVDGVWGPYYSSIVPGLWSLEGGQSATGKLVDHIVETHPAYSWVKGEAEKKSMHIFSVLNEALDFMAKKNGLADTSELTRDFHMWPDYHGNRSPLSDPTLKGMLCGLTLSSGVEDLALKYLAAIQGLAYGTRQILEAMSSAGHTVRLLLACGGQSKNRVYIQVHADVTGLPVVIPRATEPVLLGSAILGACASGKFASIQDAMQCMGGTGDVLKPNQEGRSFHDKKYEVFLKMVEHQKEYRAIMSQ